MNWHRLLEEAASGQVAGGSDVADAGGGDDAPLQGQDATDRSQSAPADAPPAPDFFSFTLPSDDRIPEKLQGKGVDALLKAHRSAESMVGKNQARIRELEEAASQANEDALSLPKGAFREAISAGMREGTLDDETVGNLAKALDVDGRYINEFVGYYHEKMKQTMGKADQYLLNHFRQESNNNESTAPSAAALQEWAEQNLPDERLQMFNMLIEEGSLEPFKLILQDMAKAGANPTQLTQQDGRPVAEPTDKVPHQRPTEPSVPTPTDYYETREQFMADLKEAGPDLQKQDAVMRKLKRSPANVQAPPQTLIG